MATKYEHLDWAAQNERFAEQLDCSTQIGANWAITALFYAAVHYVDAYFVARTNRPLIHRQRETQINNSIHLRDVRSEYRMLQVMSEEARYHLAAFGESDFVDAKKLLQTIRAAVVPNVR